MTFDNPQLTELLKDAPAAARKDFSVAAIHFPSWHPTPFFEAQFGFGWSEWELVKRARPRFEGHRQPIEPLWGHYDESDPAWAAREIDAAADHGIDAFIVDWYWHCGVELLHEYLARGFLQAPNRRRMKFGLMWANHSHMNPYPAPLTGSLPTLLPIRHSFEDLDRVMDVCCERYFRQDNYWRIDGKCWFSFFLLAELLNHLGGESALGRAVERMRRRVQANGCGDLYLGCFARSPKQAEILRRTGFDHATQYNITAGWNVPDFTAMHDYQDVMIAHVRAWQAYQETGFPYWPVATVGWDVTPRNHPYEPWPPVRWEWPWGHTVVHNTPERFGQLVHAARRFMGTQTRKPKALVLNAWNEWSEGSALAPTKDQGWAVLENLRGALEA